MFTEKSIANLFSNINWCVFTFYQKIYNEETDKISKK